MLFISVLLVTAATFAAAQSITSTTTASAATASTSCAAQEVLDACIGTEQALVNSCLSNDYSCLCNNYGNLLTCYANCPNDPGVTSVQQYQTQFCSAASEYGTTTLMVAKSTTSSATATSSGSGSVTGTGFSFPTASASNTATSASASATNGAAAGHIAFDVLGFLAAGAVFFL